MRWRAWRLKRQDALRLGRVRHRMELQICEAEGYVWARAANLIDASWTELSGLPAVEFLVLVDGQLIERGSQVPQGYLPDGPWLPIAEWMQVDLAVPALGAKPTKVSVQFARSSDIEEPNLLLASFVKWHTYAVSAPQVRLDRLAFAVNDAGGAVIRGEPLPPLKGTRFVERGGVAIEAGWTWQPRVTAEVMAAAMGLADGEVALVRADGCWDRLADTDFVQASRAAVRQTAEEIVCGQ